MERVPFDAEDRGAAFLQVGALPVRLERRRGEEDETRAGRGGERRVEVVRGVREAQVEAEEERRVALAGLVGASLRRDDDAAARGRRRGLRDLRADEADDDARAGGRRAGERRGPPLRRRRARPRRATGRRC